MICKFCIYYFTLKFSLTDLVPRKSQKTFFLFSAIECIPRVDVPSNKSAGCTFFSYPLNFRFTTGLITNTK